VREEVGRVDDGERERGRETDVGRMERGRETDVGRMERRMAELMACWLDARSVAWWLV
jgi:hypothetical protein